jgi:hypothetical protein
MRKLLLIFVFLLLFPIDIHATMYQHEFYRSISYNYLNVNSSIINIDTSFHVPDIMNINNDGYWEKGYIISDFNARPIPEPATMFLLGTGLICLAWLGRKKYLKSNRL